VDEQIQARVIQGLMNREKPSLFLIASPKDEFWLSQLHSHETRISRITDLDDSTYPVIRYEPSSLLQTYLAITLSGVHDAIPVSVSEDRSFETPPLAPEDKRSIPQLDKGKESSQFLFDLTSLSEDDLHNLMLETSRKTSTSMISFRNTPNPEHIDLLVKHRIFLSPLTITGFNPLLAGTRKSLSEARLLKAIIHRMDPDFAMIGYNINPGIIGEYETIRYLSKHGGFSIPVPGVSNLSFFYGMNYREVSQLSCDEHSSISPFPTQGPQSTSFPQGSQSTSLTHGSQSTSFPQSSQSTSLTHGSQSNPSPTPSTNGKSAPKHKTYIVILMSDGDNLDLPYSKFENFSQPHTTPLGWSLSPFLKEFAPLIYDYYMSNLQKNDCFVAAPSGGGFCYPSAHKYLPAFIEHTQRFMEESLIEYLWLLDHPLRGYSSKLLEKFSRICRGMFLEYVIIRPYSHSIRMYGGIPAVFSSGFVERDGVIAEKILQKTPQPQTHFHGAPQQMSPFLKTHKRNSKDAPSFLFIGVEMRYNTPRHIDSEIAKLDPDHYEAVSVPRFMELIRENH